MSEERQAPTLDAGLDDLVSETALRSVRRNGTDDERLLDLFWNRADLKKRFSTLRDQLDAQRDEIKAKEEEIERARQDKRALEGMLVDPDTAFTAMVYYQLRGLYESARIQLESFSEELSNQQKDRERKKQIMEFNQDREKRLKDVSAQIARIKTEADEAKQALAALEGEFATLTGIFNYFKRRKMQPLLEQRRNHYESVRSRIEELFDRRIKLESEPWPDYPGLSAEGKRVINLAVIALAQHLYIHFSENSLGEMSRVTTLKRVQDIDYGTRPDCEFLMNRIAEAVLSMKNDRGFANELRARSKFLRTRAEFRSEHDTVPVPGSIGNIPIAVPGIDLGNTVAGVPLEVNVMIDDYWNLSKVLLR